MKQFLQLLALIFILSVCFPPSAASAQQAGQWTEPIDLSNTVTMSESPSITADPAGGVHVVWLESLPDGNRTILYTSLKNGNWSAPIDIVSNVNMFGQGGPRLASDDQGILHLVYPSIYGIAYSRAFAPEAGSPRAWSTPIVLVPGNSYLSDFDLAVGSGSTAGLMCLAYAQQIGSGSGVYVTCSRDGGQTWEEPYMVYDNQDTGQMVNEPRLAIAPDGSLHIVWSISSYPETFPPLGIRYSRSTDGGLTWSSEVDLADGPYANPAITLCAAPRVHVVWSGTTTDRYKFHRWSEDDGKTWSVGWRNLELGGIQGRPDLACDSSGHIHWLMVGTIFGAGVAASAKNKDSLYHTVYIQGQWSSGEILMSGSTEFQNLRDAQAAITLGNQLHVVVINPLPVTAATWQDDIFYTSELLDSPARPAGSLQNPYPVLTPTPEALGTLVPSPTPIPLTGHFVPVDSVPWQSVGVGAMAAFSAIILMLLIHFTRMRR